MSKIAIGTTAVGTGADPGDTIVTEMAFGQPATPGILTTFSREDHTHGTMPAPPAPPAPGPTVVTEQAFGQASNPGALATYSREDHTHGTPPAPAAGGGHLGCGGGTLVGGVPLYNYEDADLFVASWHWGCYPSWTISVQGGLVDKWGSHASWSPSMITYDNGLVSSLGGSNGFPGGVATSYGGLIGHPIGGIYFRTAVGYTKYVTCHYMVKQWCLDLDPNFHYNGSAGTGCTKWSLSIGFTSTPKGCYFNNPIGWANGLYFGYCNQFPALFPNANYYACANATGVIGGMYVLDTGVPVVSLVPHKFNVVMGRRTATFYIDNVLVATITDVAAGASWPVNLNTYPVISCANLDNSSKYLDMEFSYPIVTAYDKVAVP